MIAGVSQGWRPTVHRSLAVSPMRPPIRENPSEHERTPADRQADYPVLFWTILGLLAILAFVALMVFIRHHPR